MCWMAGVRVGVCAHRAARLSQTVADSPLPSFPAVPSTFTWFSDSPTYNPACNPTMQIARPQSGVCDQATICSQGRLPHSQRVLSPAVSPESPLMGDQVQRVG